MRTVLGEADWRVRQEAHHVRVDAWIAPHLERARLGDKHPVHDFLFTYYSHRPAQLRRWHPGVGVGLAGDAPHRDWTNYATAHGVVAVDLEQVLARRAGAIGHLVGLLQATASRRPLFGCFGLHEWAMVYRTDEIRHESFPLRLPPEELAAVVEAEPLRCTHYDAFRFFTPEAAPRNLLQLTREAMPQHEQGGCLHTNMDLYGRFACGLVPLVPSELVADCFELAWDLRSLDMRASPYDFRSLGFEPIRVETEEGRVEYVRLQRLYAERGAELRLELLRQGGQILALASELG